MLVVPRLACTSWRWMTFALTTVARSPHVDSKHDRPRGGRTSRPSRRWRAPLGLGGLLGTNGHKRIETRTRQLLLLTQGVAQRVGSHCFGHLLPTKQEVTGSIPGWLHHLDEGRTGPVPQGIGPSAFPDREDRVHRLIEALLAVRS